MQLRLQQAENEKQLAELLTKEQAFEEAAEKLNKIQTIYGASEMEALSDVLADRIRDAVLKIEALKKQGVECAKNAERLAEGRLIGVSEAAKKVLDYIETRHGSAAMNGLCIGSAGGQAGGGTFSKSTACLWDCGRGLRYPGRRSEYPHD